MKYFYVLDGEKNLKFIIFNFFFSYVKKLRLKRTKLLDILYN